MEEAKKKKKEIKKGEGEVRDGGGGGGERGRIYERGSVGNKRHYRELSDRYTDASSKNPAACIGLITRISLKARQDHKTTSRSTPNGRLSSCHGLRLSRDLQKDEQSLQID